METSECQSFGATIIWAKTAAGLKIPLDAEPEVRFFFQRDVLEDVIPSGMAREDVGAVKTYRSHFATCPDADEWRGD